MVFVNDRRRVQRVTVVLYMSLAHTSQVFAHRGIHDATCPENTCGAFARAVAAGVGIECDVRMSADGVPFVFHDADGVRMTGRRGCVDACTMAELAALRLGDTQEHISTLRDVVAMVAGRVPVICEVKTRLSQRARFVRAIAEVLSSYDGDYVCASFDPFLARALRRAMPQARVGYHISDYPHNNRVVALCKRLLARLVYGWSGFVPDFFVVRATFLDRYGDPRRRGEKHVPMFTWGIQGDAQRHRLASLVTHTIDDMRA